MSTEPFIHPTKEEQALRHVELAAHHAGAAAECLRLGVSADGAFRTMYEHEAKAKALMPWLSCDFSRVEKHLRGLAVAEGEEK